MARRDKSRGGGTPPQLWLLTFSDLTTLLLTFFVMLLSMSSMDMSFMARLKVFDRDLGYMPAKGAGRVDDAARILARVLERPEDNMFRPDRIKDMLLPDEELPPEVDTATLKANLEVLKRPEGVALVLSDKLLFPTGSAELSDAARVVLDRIAAVIGLMRADVNVSGHADAVGGRSEANYRLSADRAVSVLQHILSRGLDPLRFSLSAYGPDAPLPGSAEAGKGPEELARDRRVEILLKTDRAVGSYS